MPIVSQPAHNATPGRCSKAYAVCCPNCRQALVVTEADVPSLTKSSAEAYLRAHGWVKSAFGGWHHRGRCPWEASGVNDELIEAAREALPAADLAQPEER